MSAKNAIRYLADASGKIEGVLLPWALWEKVEPQIKGLLREEPNTPVEQQPGPLKSFEEFLHFWNFKYAYDPAVRCPHCAASCADWRAAAGQPFVLTNANIGGLLVFHCRGCGSTVRQKHFRDHVALEHTTPPAP